MKEHTPVTHQYQGLPEAAGDLTNSLAIWSLTCPEHPGSVTGKLYFTEKRQIPLARLLRQIMQNQRNSA
jgi:hypothetical protein